MKYSLVIAILTSQFVFFSAAHASRDSITIVGSSTMFPFSKVVAERFGRKTPFKAPKVEPTGTGGGFKEFCRGLGISTPDIVNASRRIKPSELRLCQSNGVNEVIEIHIGYDGIVLANAIDAKPFELTVSDIFLALAKKVPDQEKEGVLIDNPYTYWNQINPNLSKTKISIIGPPPTSGTRDAFVALVMESGCKKTAWIKALENKDKKTFKKICHSVRDDGVFIEARENDNLIVRKLKNNPEALGIFGFSFLDQNADKVKAAVIDGHAPSFEAISDGRYIVSRPLYFYVKKAHVLMIPGVKAFLHEFISDAASAHRGYLTEKGLIPLDEQERRILRDKVKSAVTLDPAAL